jgi:hypothetical protein
MDMDPNVKDYIELKTVKKAEGKHKFSNKGMTRWYLQSYLSGVPNLKIGYRNPEGTSCTIEEMLVEGIIQDTPRINPMFNMGRVHAILFKLFKYFRRGRGQSASDQDRFELRVNAEGDAHITKAAEPTSKAKPTSMGADCASFGPASRQAGSKPPHGVEVIVPTSVAKPSSDTSRKP